MSCVVCIEPSKYSCPRCRARYCSVGCFQKHKLTCETQGSLIPKTSESPQTSGEPTQIRPHVDENGHLRVPYELLQTLAKSSKLISILQDRRLQQVITNVDGSGAFAADNLERRIKSDEDFLRHLQICYLKRSDFETKKDILQ